MNTAGTSLLFMLCVVAVVAAALQSVAPLVEGRLSWRHVPVFGWIVWLCVAVPSLAQIPFPRVYSALHRDAHAVTAGHQWWRLLTSVVVQDGGIIGMVSNLVLLALPPQMTSLLRIGLGEHEHVPDGPVADGEHFRHPEVEVLRRVWWHGRELRLPRHGGILPHALDRPICGKSGRFRLS